MTPNISLKNMGMGAGMEGSGAQAQVTPALKKPVSGITNPGDIRSNVVNKPLNIPDFLQKK